MWQKRGNRERFSSIKDRLCQQGSSKVCSMVFDHFGNWGKEVDKFLDEMLEKCIDSEGRSNEHEFRNRGRRHFLNVITEM